MQPLEQVALAAQLQACGTPSGISRSTLMAVDGGALHRHDVVRHHDADVGTSAGVVVMPQQSQSAVICVSTLK